MSCCGGGMWMMWLWPILLVALLVVGVIVVRRLWMSSRPERRSSRASGRPALDVLEERYARGEIDRDEFERRRRALSSQASQRRA
jgi:putative membrane protein